MFLKIQQLIFEYRKRKLINYFNYVIIGIVSKLEEHDVKGFKITPIYINQDCLELHIHIDGYRNCRPLLVKQSPNNDIVFIPHYKNYNTELSDYIRICTNSNNGNCEVLDTIWFNVRNNKFIG